MTGYDFYIMLRGLDELLERFLPILIIAAVGIVAAVLLRIWVRRNSPGASGLVSELHALKKRVDALEARLRAQASPGDGDDQSAGGPTGPGS